MKSLARVVLLLGGAAAWGCASPGTAEDFKWSIEIPNAVDKGSEFTFVVKTSTAAGEAVPGVNYRWQIVWTRGSPAPMRHKGRTGEPEKLHAHLDPGPATIVVISKNRAGLEAKVLEQTFEVK